jgi:uncharacterized protein (TIGR03067 family)
MKWLPLILAFVASLASAQGTDSATELKKFEGTWTLAAGHKDGKPIAPADVGGSKITYKGKDVVIATPHQAKEPYKVEVVVGMANGKRTMEFHRKSGPDAGKVVYAIYEFRSPDEYVVAYGPVGTPAPAELDSKPGSGVTMHHWKRVKQ